MNEGKLGETYNIGGFNEKRNIEVVSTICEILNEQVANKPDGISDFKELITYALTGLVMMCDMRLMLTRLTKN